MKFEAIKNWRDRDCEIIKIMWKQGLTISKYVKIQNFYDNEYFGYNAAIK